MSSLRTTPRDVEIVTVAEASEAHPRHGGVDMIERKDGSIFMSKMLIHKSGLELGAGDDAPSDLVTLVSRDGGRTWGDQKVFLQPGPDETAAYCPGFLRLKSGEILFRYEMYHHFVKGEPWSITSYAAFSDDECESFSDPAIIFSRSSHMAGSMNDLRQLSTGRIVIPTVYMEGTALQEDGEGHLAPTNTSVSGTYYSDDDGRSWKECDNWVYLPMRGSMEPKIEELKDGRLMMIMRTQLGSVFKSYSEDGGASWSDAQTTGLRSPESCPLLMRVPQTGDLLLIWNDSPYNPKFDHYGIRNPLSTTISKDDGLTWLPSKPLETDPEWEFTNPAAMITKDNRLLVAYEASKYASLDPPGMLGRTRMHLKLAMVDVDWLYG